MNSFIDRDKLIQYLREYKINDILISTDELEIKGFNDGIDLAISVIADFPSVELDNQVDLCCYCKYFLECSAEISDIIFGNGIGHINVCACPKFAIKSERTAKVEQQLICWEDIRHYKEGMCASCGRNVYDHAKYCDECGCRLIWGDNDE